MLEGVWVSANIMASSIYDALEWSKENIQPLGIAVTNINDQVVDSNCVYYMNEKGESVRW